jgi:hypothetical protein
MGEAVAIVAGFIFAAVIVAGAISDLTTKVQAMSDSTKAALDALAAEVSAAVAKIQTGSGASQELTDAIAKVNELTAQLHAANNPA